MELAALASLVLGMICSCTLSFLPSAAIRGKTSPQLANPWLFRMGRKPKLLLPIGHLQFHDLTETFAWVISFASSKPESKFR
jgi:hypothetical protein